MLGGLLGRGHVRRSAVDEAQSLRSAILEAKELAESLSKSEDQHFSEDIAQSLRVIKDVLFPEVEAKSMETSNDTIPTVGLDESDDVRAVVDVARTTDLLLVLADGIGFMGFETRKDAVQVFNNLLRRVLGDDNASQDLISRDGSALIAVLVKGYDDPDVALNCGSMFRECLRSEHLASVALRHKTFWRFFDLVEVSDFDVASDAFASFKEMLTRHVHIGAMFVEEQYDRFTTSYNNLLRSGNYVTRRQSLKLLGQILVERKFFKIMTQYISSATNLRLLMNLLLDQRKNIQFEAFHVFKIFVANPNKTAEVRQILIRNKDRLLVYLADFQSDRQDASFQDDRVLILDEIRKLA